VPSKPLAITRIRVVCQAKLSLNMNFPTKAGNLPESFFADISSGLPKYRQNIPRLSVSAPLDPGFFIFVWSVVLQANDLCGSPPCL
jgi:hypothetical protein